MCIRDSQRRVHGDDFLWRQPRNNPLYPVPLPNQGDNPLRVGDRDLHPVPNPFNPYAPSNAETGNFLGPNSGVFTGGGQFNPLPTGPFPGNVRFDPYGPDGMNASFPDNIDIEPISQPKRWQPPQPGSRSGGSNQNNFNFF
eukprot:TRINITY_DN10040_c0_g1_i2.p2 TRINITY_DN10040_c0_g1~~TRINITY_DN10040_c0_g1_i2.p2  ORF type:complete len:141 (+),score=36.93 TRINITY_DN10040_c0_g1_i2:63-485(+)